MASETEKEDSSGNFHFEQPTSKTNKSNTKQKEQNVVSQNDSHNQSQLQTQYLKKIYKILVFFLVLIIIQFIISLFNIAIL